MTWRLVVEILASVGYGILSSLLPMFNSELYVAATQALGLTIEVTAALGTAAGQAIGKGAIVLALRNGTRIAFLARQIDRLQAREADAGAGEPVGRVRGAPRRWSGRLLDLVGHPRWGVLIVFASGLCAVPPLFAVQFVVPATRMRVWVFAVAVFAGRSLLLLAVAFGASAIVERLLG